MIKTNDSKVLFSGEEQIKLAEKESEIDRLLENGKGKAEIKFEVDFDRRLLNELARRYQDEGWTVTVMRKGRDVAYTLTLSDPRLDEIIVD